MNGDHRWIRSRAAAPQTASAGLLLVARQLDDMDAEQAEELLEAE